MKLPWFALLILGFSSSAFSQHTDIPFDPIEPDAPVGEISLWFEGREYIQGSPPSQNEVVVIPFLDSHGRLFEFSGDLTALSYVILSGQDVAATGAIGASDADLLRQLGRSAGPSPAIAFCATPITLKFCVAVGAAVIGAVAGGIVDWMLDYDSGPGCADQYQNAMRSLAAESMSCINRAPAGDGKTWEFNVHAFPDSNICGSTGYGTCSLN